MQNFGTRPHSFQYITGRKLSEPVRVLSCTQLDAKFRNSPGTFQHTNAGDTWFYIAYCHCIGNERWGNMKAVNKNISPLNFEWYPEFPFEKAVVPTLQPVDTREDRCTLHQTSIEERHNFNMNYFFCLRNSIEPFHSVRRPI